MAMFTVVDGCRLMVDSPKSESAFFFNHEPSTANCQLKMRAMILEAPRQPLRSVDLPTETRRRRRFW